MSASSADPSSKWLFVSLTVIAMIYLLTIPQNFTEGEDAVYYAEHVSVGLPAWHPNHLIYEPVNAWIVEATGGDALRVMQRISFVAALATLALVWLLAVTSGAGAVAALAAVWCVAGCFAFWLYGLYPDTYALPMPFVLSSLLAMMQRRVLLAACLAAIATLLHQSHLFLWPAAILWLVIADRKWINGALYTVVFTAIVGGTYLWVGRNLGHETTAETLAWARGYASDGLWTPLSLMSPIKAVIGLVTAIWSLFFLFADSPLAGMVEQFFLGRMLVEEVFFAETGLALGVWPLLILTAISMAGLSILAIRAIFRPGTPKPAFLALNAGIYAVVVTIWEPTNKEFWIAVLPLLVLVVFLRLDPLSRAMKVTATLAISTLWLANGAGAMIGFSSSATDYWHTENAYFIAETNAGDVIVDDCGYICTGYLLLFSPAEVLPVDALDLAAETGPGRILITTRAIAVLDAAGSANWIAQRSHLQPSGDWRDLHFMELPRIPSP